MEFFRFCPECGRRFHIKLESKERVNLTRETIRRPRVARGSPSRGYGPRDQSLGTLSPVIVVYEGEPIIIDIEEFRYRYKCKHCGHEWSEKYTEKHREN